ncbi:MAG TPA: class I SAM-dependent methyltransferase [Alphaproteobacteria bacterium]|nr:class I SAM-dependent methyltransferase [Alphaproteobacteria bacterium]
MPHDGARRSAAFPDEIAVAKAHAVYTPFMLSAYDLLVHGVSNRLAWRCPTRRLLDLYRANLSIDHLEVGVGTGFFLDKAATSRFDRLALLDINRHCLERSARRLARFDPELHEVNLLAPIELALPPFASVGLTYVLHCLPGVMSEKLAAVDHLRPLMRKGAVLFGATILGRGVAPNPAARKLLDLYNAKGVFNNRDDDLDTLSRGLRQRFDAVEIVTQGLVAIFHAT